MGGGGTYRNTFKPSTAVKVKTCRCGGGCGLTWEFRFGAGQGARRYHPECPVIAAKEKARKAASNARMHERRKLNGKAELDREKKQRKKLGRPCRERPPEEPHIVSPWRKPRYGKFCEGCGGLAHRRPPGGCSICLLPYAPERHDTHSPQRVSSTSWDT